VLSVDGSDGQEITPAGIQGTRNQEAGFGIAGMSNYAFIFRAVAERVPTAVLSTGARVLDSSDFKAWLIELAEKAEEAETLEQFFLSNWRGRMNRDHDSGCSDLESFPSKTNIQYIRELSRPSDGCPEGQPFNWRWFDRPTFAAGLVCKRNPISVV
jgi:hypothetical protein